MQLATPAARFVLPLLLTATAALRLAAAEGDTLAAAAANTDAESALKKFSVAPGLKVELFAAEPDIRDITSFAFDEKGNVLVVETGRRRTSVFDIRGLTKWLDEDFALRTVDDRIAFLKRHVSPADPEFLGAVGSGAGRGGFRDYNKDGVVDWRDLEVESERLRFLRVTNGRVVAATTFADGFNSTVSGVAAGVLARDGKVWFTCIPDLWQLQDTRSTGTADVRTKLQGGFGVHVAYGGHDMHGLAMGPDGRIYWSIADRGTSTNLFPGLRNSFPGLTPELLADSGAVFRANPDGSDFEVFAIGLRNPQELAFDDDGNLFTGDNNGDGGDKARWTWVVEGGDYGWRIGWQWLPKMGPWNSEMIWGLGATNTATYIVPPVAHIGHGPAGIASYPGTGLPDRYKDHFFYSDFPGGIRSFQLKPLGAGFTADNPKDYLQDNSPEKMDGKLLWNLYPVDVDFGPEGGLYVADWVQGWEKTGKARIWRVFDPEVSKQPIVQETKRLLSEGMKQRPSSGLEVLLGHADRRVRLDAQLELMRRGTNSLDLLSRAAESGSNHRARLHAIWALTRFGETNLAAVKSLLYLVKDRDAEIRAQAVRGLGEGRLLNAAAFIDEALLDTSPRVRFFAAIAWGKLQKRIREGKVIMQPSLLEEVQARLASALTAPREGTVGPSVPFEIKNIVQIAGSTGDDGFLRHAVVQALTYSDSPAALASLAENKSASVRLAACLAMRRLHRPEVARFLDDADPQIVLEAARAINDEAIYAALPQLAALTPSGSLAATSQFPPIERRVINAHFRLGGPANASALAGFAANPKLPEALRAEAIAALADWSQPPVRDKIVGLYRPLPARDGSIAAAVLQPLLTDLLVSGSEPVQTATIQAVTKLGLRTAGASLADLVRAANAKGAVRAEALKSLAVLKDARLADVVRFAAADPDPTLRKEAASLQTRLNPGNALAQLTQALSKGSISEQQAALVALGGQAGSETVLSKQLDLLLAGQLRHELELDLLEAAAKRADPGLKPKLDQFNASRDSKNKLSSHRETLYGGDAAAGKRVFYERQDIACFRCHKINGEGGEVGPDLTGIGARQSREYILESILYPNAQISAGYENVLVTLKTGTTYAGQLKKETSTELTINAGEDGLVTIRKSDLKSRERGLSSMLEDLGNLLGKRDLRDVVEFLASSR